MRRILSISNSLTLHIVLLCFFWGGVAWLSHWLGVEDFLTKQFERPILFKVRHSLGKTPLLNDKLVIYSFDDSTFSKLGRPFPTLREWSTILKNIARAKPRTVIISKVFSDNPDQLDRDHSLKEISSLGIDIVAGAFLVRGTIKGRHALKPEGQDRAFFTWLPINKTPQDETIKYVKVIQDQNVYGPSEPYLLEKAFTHLGNITSFDFDINTFAPVINFNNQLFLPHISLFAAEKREIDRGSLMLEGAKIPLQTDGNIQVNHLPPESIYNKGISSLGNLLSDDAKGAMKRIREGDVVLILTDMFTGGTTFIQTPFGLAPSSFSLIANVNSILSKSWITKFEWIKVLIFCGGLLGAGLSLSGSLALFWSGFFLTIFLALALEFFLFSYENIYLSLMLPMFTFAFIALTVFAYMARAKEKKLLLMRIVEAEKKRLEIEMRDAALIAKALLPDSIPHWPFCNVEVFHKPLTEASGDWFAFEESLSGKVFHFILCDITGHGVQGAMVASTCKTVLSLLIERNPDLLESQDFPAKFGEQVNSTLFRQGHGTHVATLLAITFIPEQDKFFFVSAGHPLPLLLDQELNQKPLTRTAANSKFDPPGLTAGICMSITENPFIPGDQLVAFTDGLPLKGGSKLTKILGASWQETIKTPQELYAAAWQAETKKSGKKPDDDVSVVWFKRKR